MLGLAVTVGAGYHFPRLLANEEVCLWLLFLCCYVLVLVAVVVVVVVAIALLLTLTKSEQEPPEQYSIMIQRFAPLRNEAKYL
jgi:hypothetical protein